ncbi:MAG: autotransporter domain-containing protein [Candidatus Adiutrix sp.]|jgi:uncharacterized protein with beta-barrel porin domain|nr:autotransporter domain-containing protein [Candidatus Adiutrix sp.]
MSKSIKMRPLAAAAAVCALSGWLWSAQAQAQATDGQELHDALAAAAAGQTVVLAPGAEIDLYQNGVEFSAPNVTLSGSADYDLGARIRAEAAAIVAQGRDAGQAGLSDRLTSIVADLLDNLPDNRIFNSQPKGYGSGVVFRNHATGAIMPAPNARGGDSLTAPISGTDWTTITNGGSVSSATTINYGPNHALYPGQSIVVDAIYDREALDHGADSGISAVGGGFVLKNINFEGTHGTVRAADAISGASVVYQGLVGSNLRRAAGVASSGMQGLENVTFVDNVIETEGAVQTVGNVLFFSQRKYPGTDFASGGETIPNSPPYNYIETLDYIKGSVFRGNKIYNDLNASVGMRTPAAAGAGWVNIGLIEDSLFADNFNQGHHAFGGAIYAQSLGDVVNSVFFNNVNTTDHEAWGGGIMANSINGISGSVFIGNSARGLKVLTQNANGAIDADVGALGGAVYAGGGISFIENSLFAYNAVFNDTPANGAGGGGGDATGGAVGSGLIGSIKNSSFIGNAAQADTFASGGAINMSTGSGVAPTTSIINSLFLDNSVEARDEASGGALNISLGGSPFTLNLTAEDGGLTAFAGNTVNGEPNSITASGGQNMTINVDAGPGSRVELIDPLLIDLDGSAAFALNSAGAGAFIWGGYNDLNAAGGSAVNLAGNGLTVLGADFTLASSKRNPVSVDLSSNAGEIRLDLKGRDLDQPFFSGVDFAGLADANITGEYLSLTDVSASFAFASESGGVQAFSSTLTDAATGVSTTISVGTDGQGRLEYQGPVAAFNAAGTNALLARPALAQAWENLSESLTVEESGAFFPVIVGDLINSTAEPFAASGQAVLASVGSVVSQVLKGNQISRGASRYAPAAGDGDGLRPRLWVDYIGSFIDQKNSDGRNGYENRQNGLSLGLALDVSDDLSVGAWTAYSSGKLKFKNLASNIDTDIIQGGMFAQYRPVEGGFGGTLDLSLARADNDSSRYFAGSLYEASYNQQLFGLGLTVGYEFDVFSGAQLTPYLSARFQHLAQDSFREQTLDPLAGFAIESDSASGDDFTATLGLNLEKAFDVGAGRLVPAVNLGWRHQFGDEEIISNYRFRGPGGLTTAMATARSAESSDAGVLGLSLTLTPGSSDAGLSLKLGYDGALSSDRTEHNFYGGLEYSF